MTAGPLVNVLEIAVEGRTRQDHDRLRDALRRLSEKGEPWTVSTDDESGQTVLACASELQVQSLVGRLRDEFALTVDVGAPQAAYLETISAPADIDYTHKRLRDGGGEYARVRLRLEPLSRGSGFAFAIRAVSGAIPDVYVPAMKKGVEDAVRTGPLADFPLIDLKVELVDGAYHDVDSSPHAFEIAARAAMREGLVKAGAVLLEPVMLVKVATPPDCMGEVVADINQRRGQILSVDNRPDNVVWTATVPMANLFGYASALSSLTGGRGDWSMQFHSYEPAPPPEPDPRFPGAAAAGVA